MYKTKMLKVNFFLTNIILGIFFVLLRQGGVCNNYIGGQSRFLTVHFQLLFKIYNRMYMLHFQTYKFTNFVVIVLFVFRTPFDDVCDVTSFLDFARTPLL